MIKILYQDSDYIVVHKPTGLMVHRSYLSSDTVFLLQELRNQIGQQVFPVHRLDRPTSGVIVFALNKEAAREFSEQIQAHKVQKTYWAVVRGYAPEEFFIDYAIAPDKNKPKQEAQTKFRLLATASFPIANSRYTTSRYSLLECQPLTGRYHQIRKHCAHMSHHIIGDTMHGKGEHNQIFRDHFDLERLLLIAKKIIFYHFRLDKIITIETELEDEFRGFLERAEWEFSH